MALGADANVRREIQAALEVTLDGLLDVQVVDQYRYVGMEVTCTVEDTVRNEINAFAKRMGRVQRTYYR